MIRKRAVGLHNPQRREALARAAMDMNSTDVEVFGSECKRAWLQLLRATLGPRKFDLGRSRGDRGPRT